MTKEEYENLPKDLESVLFEYGFCNGEDDVNFGSLTVEQADKLIEFLRANSSIKLAAVAQ